MERRGALIVARGTTHPAGRGGTPWRFGEADLLKALSGIYRTHFVSTEKLSKADIPRATVQMIPRRVAETLGVFPVLFFSGLCLALLLWHNRISDLWLRGIGLALLSIAFASKGQHQDAGVRREAAAIKGSTNRLARNR